jgi:hypothetical protein
MHGVALLYNLHTIRQACFVDAMSVHQLRAFFGSLPPVGKRILLP